MQLNPQQEKAVAHTEGPLLLIAGAGSGKTRVLTERLARIIESKLAEPEETLTVTFTNKAANEIKERALKRLNRLERRVTNIPWMGTFHSIALRMLRKDAEHIGYSSNFSIYDTDDQLALIRRVMQDRNISSKRITPKSALGSISSAKNELISPSKYAEFARGTYQEIISEIYIHYQRGLKSLQAMDFDDLLVNSVLLLQTHEPTKEKYQRLFKYILVDEYQDTNHVQYVLIKTLSEKYNNLCVVGDDDQSIYAWRGANIRNILEFEQDFRDVTVIKLEQNYRSTKKILLAGNSVVQSIAQRKAKKLWTDNGEGQNIQVFQALDEKDEALWVVAEIERLQNSGVEGHEIAVLYRMNAQSRLLEESFLQAGIAYKLVGAVRFYERKEIKDALAYLRMIFNPKDDLSLQRIINVPSRKIGAKSIEELRSSAESVGVSTIEYLAPDEAGILIPRKRLSPALENFADLLKKIVNYSANNNVVELLKFILAESGYLTMLSEDNEKNRQRRENLDELVNVASKYSELSPEASLQAFLEEVALLEDNSRNNVIGLQTNFIEGAPIRTPVTLMTVHSAKGLEFVHVFVIGMEEGIFPHSRAFDDRTELDEERRLAYVAITRAKSNLYLTYTMSRTFFGSRNSAIPSRFLSDIPTDIIDFSSFSGEDSRWNNRPNLKNPSKQNYEFNCNIGDKVRHSQFGTGTIKSIDEELVIVDFDRYGTKEMATEYANLVKF